MYGFFPPEEAVPTLLALLEETALTFFTRAEEEDALFIRGVDREGGGDAGEDDCFIEVNQKKTHGRSNFCS